MGAPVAIRDLAAIRCAHLGPERLRTAMRLVELWWRAGHTHRPTLLALVDWYVERGEFIREPFAYFNPRSRAFADMHASIAARVAEAEGDAHKQADAKAAERWKAREAALHEVRADVEDFTP